MEEENMEPHSLKKTLPFLLSISIFSFFLSYSSWYHPISFNSLHASFSTFISNLFNYHINRQSMFLLCNGILLFVTGGAGRIRSSTSIADSALKVVENKPSVGVDRRIRSSTSVADSALEVVEMKASVGGAGRILSLRSVADSALMKASVGRAGRIEEDLGSSLVQVVEEKQEVEEEEEACGYDNDDDKENCSLVIEESDERFEKFIKEMKEKMMLENRQLVLMV